MTLTSMSTSAHVTLPQRTMCPTWKTLTTHRTVPLLLIFILVVFVLSMQLKADVVEINQQSHALFVMANTIKVGDELLFNE